MAIGPQSKPTDTSPVSPFDVKKKALEIKKTFAHKKTTNPKPKVNFDLSRNLIVSYDPKAVGLAQPLNSQSKSSAIERANEVQASLPSELPSFVKLMLPSHVTGCFWLGLPKKFCDAHLPNDDVTVVLVDKDDQKFNTKYLDRKTGLSGGWKAFSVAHKLLAGDALVFQLIEQWKMKMANVNAQTRINSSAFRSMLEKHTLTGPNFNEWFRALKLVVRTEKIQDVFETTLPPRPVGFEHKTPLEMYNELYQMYGKHPGVELQEYKKNKQQTVGASSSSTLQVMTIQGGRVQKKPHGKAKGKGKAKSGQYSYPSKTKKPQSQKKERPAKEGQCHHCKEVGH
nr:B3 DNA binding domain-containing protein [Tanacetum cinerariifolium]